MRILLVEDDPPLAAGLAQALGRQGFTVNHVDHGRSAIHVARTDPPDAMILDLGLPDMDGLVVLRAIREHDRELPVLILTARGTTDERVRGLDAGADDYLPKPFEIPELVARLRVIERRLGSQKTSEIRIGEVILDTLAQRVEASGREVQLSRKEYVLLKILMENANRVMTRSALEDRLYSWGEEVSSNALEVHVHNLRKKLGSGLITTVHGVGYKVSVD